MRATGKPDSVVVFLKRVLRAALPGVLLVLLGAAAAGAQVSALSEALDQPTWEFTTSGDSAWYSSYWANHDGSDGAEVDLYSASTTSTLQTVRALEAGYLTFWWRTEAYGSGKIAFYLDDVAAPAAEYRGWAWQQRIFAVGAGEHTLRWVVESGDDMIVAYLDEVGLATVPPDVIVSVNVSGVSPPPEIAVDTIDLDGKQNDASGSFTRRYSFNASSQVRFTAPARQGSYALTSWQGCDATEGTGGEVCVVGRDAGKSITAQYAFRPLLAEALDQSTWEFTTSGDAAWYGTNYPAHDSTDAARADLAVPNESATVQTVRTFEAGYLSFWWYAYNRYGTGRLQFFLDDLAVPAAESSSSWDWQRQILAVSAGEHTLRWVARSGDSGINGYLDAVEFSATPPAVTVAVQVYGATPTPGIVVDTLDLDGNQNGTSDWFTRRYSYHASAQVRLTAPTREGSYAFSSWSGCAAAEGTNSEVCVVDLKGDRTVSAEYIFRPLLPEALDQPTWEFATSGDSAWYGTNNWSHDFVDSAETQLSLAYRSATIQSVRTLGAGYVSFWWSASTSGSGKLRFFLDDMAVPVAEYGGQEWQRQTVAVSAGDHTLRWVAQSGSSAISARVDEVTFATAPPDVVVSVQVSGVSPAPEIAVDTVDLDGYQNATSTSFSRRYAYDAAGQVRFTAPARQGSYALQSWSGCDATEGTGGETCVVSRKTGRSIRASYAFRPPLAEALDQPAWDFATSGVSPWFGMDDAHDGVDAAMCALQSENVSATLQTVRTFEAGYLSFWWRAESYGSGSLKFHLDNMAVPAAESAAWYWQRRTFAVTAGEHTLRWVAESGDSEIYVSLDEVVFTTAPPDVVVSVQVTGVSPAPQIVVDTVDLDGNQNGTTASFTRRYSFSAAGQVRLTAPAQQESYGLLRWSGCDATEGAGGSTCVVHLTQGRSVSAQYVFRPPLAEALDQPAWEFATSGDSGWHGTGYGHDGIDGAASELSAPSTSATLQTVRTFEAGYLSFWWLADTYGSGKVGFFLDDLAVPAAEHAGGGWQRRTFAVAAGEHTLRWVAQSGDAQLYAYLDEIVVATEPPDVVVSVAVDGATPVPEIVVDTVDLDGNQNGATASFTRRYAYSATGQVRFTAPAFQGSYAFQGWDGCSATEGAGGTTCVVSLTQPRYVYGWYDYRPSLAEALDQPSWDFATSGDSTWSGARGGHDGVDKATCGLSVPNRSCTLQTVRTLEAGYLSFWWFADNYGSGKLQFFLDDMAVPAAEYGGWTWQRRTFAVTAGEHTLRWVAQSGDEEIYASLDEVVFATEPPDVVVTVGVYGASPVPQIAVDTVDLDGNQSGASTPFTRRYAFSATGQVRFTAPATQGSYALSRWFGCDATEGAGGETCVVSLTQPKTINAEYGPGLAEALDQPAWEFATSGDARWQGTTDWAHDEWDSAYVGISAPNKSATVQTVRALEAGYLTFWWAADTYGSGKVKFFLDDLAVPAAEYTGWNWQQRVFPVTAGEHTLRWVAESGDSEIYANLDEVVLSLTPPDVTIDVRVRGAYPAPEIVVDTVDLGGYQNEAASWFQRRYAYDAAVQVRFTAPEKQGDYAFSSWSGCDASEGSGGGTCVVRLNSGKSISAQYVYRPGLPEALDQPAWFFTTSGDAAWYGTDSSTHDEVDAAQSILSSPSQSATVQTVATLEAGYISFWWAAEIYGSGALGFFLDDTAVPAATYAGVDWKQLILPVGAGEHTLRWVAESGDAPIRAYLDEVAFSTTPPPVHVAVGVYGVSPAPEIVVDTVDLDGNQNATSTRFWRRYAYHATNQVRFTAPATQGSYEFSSWFGCDATEGTGGETCVVNLAAGRGISAQYSYRPSLAEAVDQPLWEFTMSGEPAWVGAEGSSHDGTDAACVEQMSAGRSSTMQTVRTLEAGYLSFWWRAQTTGTAKIGFFLDDVAVAAGASASGYWQQRVVPVTAGEHTLRWTAESGDAAYFNACLDEVVFSATPPTVAISVMSMLAGDIAVDTTDLDGMKDGTPWFTRRYAYNPSGQVRFTALSGSNAFSSWYGCDTVEGTRGETCVVSLDGGTGIFADYHPGLSMALDQPLWAFATSGDALWHGENDGHDFWDAAVSELPAPDQTSTLETVQTLASGYLSFWWRVITPGSGKITFLLDGNALAEYAGKEWRQRILPVAAGEHTLRWVLASGDSLVSADVDEVTFSTTVPVAEVRVGATVPAAIAVDTPDLDGFASGTGYFSRRYAYDGSALVRFTAPLTHGTSGFLSWTGCDATEGTGNAVCVVNLQGGRTIVALFAGNTPPVLGAVGNKSVAEGQELTFALTATDADTDGLTYSSTALPAGATLNPATGVFIWTPGHAQSGSYPITFTVTDDGNPPQADSEEITIAVNNVNRAPVLGAVGAKSVDEGQQLSFALAATDADGNALRYSSTALPAGAALSGTTGTFVWTPGYGQAGSYAVAFTVTDDGTPNLSDVEAITITVTDANRAPEISPIGDQTVTEGTTLSFTVTAADPDGGPVTLAVEGRPSGATFDPVSGAFSWTPGYYAAGAYPVTFRASDSGTPALSDTEAITIRVVSPVGPIFSDNFTAGASAAKWRKISGSWTGGGGVYTATSLTRNNLAGIVPLHPTLSPLGAGVIQAKVKLSATAAAAGPNALLLFGYLDPARYRWVKVTRSGVQIGQTGVLDGVRAGIKKPVLRSLAVGKSLLVTVRVFPDGWVKVYLGTLKTPVASYRFVAGGRPSVVKGGAGLAALKAKSVFDDVKVWEDSALKP